MSSVLRLLGPLFALGLAACSRGAAPPTTPAFESRMPALGTPFADFTAGDPGQDVCRALLERADVSFVMIPRGAAVALEPKSGHGVAEVRDAARRVEQTFLPGVRDDERQSCRLFGDEPEVVVHLATAADGPRLEFETFEPTLVPKVRTGVRSFVAEHTRAAEHTR